MRKGFWVLVLLCVAAFGCKQFGARAAAPFHHQPTAEEKAAQQQAAQTIPHQPSTTARSAPQPSRVNPVNPSVSGQGGSSAPTSGTAFEMDGTLPVKPLDMPVASPGQLFKFVSISPDVSAFVPKAKDSFVCLDRVEVSDKKESGNVVAIFFLRDKVTGSPIAIQAEVSRNLWSQYRKCRTIQFTDDPQRFLVFQNSAVDYEGDIFPFWISRVVIAK